MGSAGRDSFTVATRAEKADLSMKVIQVLEYAKANPTVTTLAAPARAYGVTLSRLLDGM